MEWRQRESSLTVALCASLTLHALALSGAAWWYVTHTPPPRLSALARADTAPPIIVRPQEALPPPPPPPPPPQAHAPPPEDFSKATKVPLRDDSGEADGHGTANRSTPGDRPMEAAAGLEQANLTRDANNDVKSKLDDAPLPAQDGSPLGESAVAQATPSFGVVQPSEAPATPMTRQPSIAIADPIRAAVAPAPTPPADSGGALGSPTGARDVAANPMLTPRSAPKEVVGHSSLSSDTESPPFAHANSAHFHNGRMDARQGRRVKTTRIDFDIAATTAYLALGGASVTLGVNVDAAGYVQNVVILRSSGSDTIDLPAERAVYNWWFEPTKDKSGRTLPDQWVVTID
jgi:TonB family protein